MKVTEDDRQLELVDFDWWWAAGAIWSFLFLAVHLWQASKGFWLTLIPLAVWATFCSGFLLLSTRSYFAFDKEAEELRWHRIGITGRETGSFQFADLKSAAIKTEWPEWNAPTNRIELITNNQSIFVQTGFTLESDDKLKQVLNQIKRVIVASRKSNAVRTDKAPPP